MRIRLGHSPDPDDAFMFYGLAAGKVDDGGFQVEHVIEDIQTLNERATRGELEVTALSLHAWSYVADRYILTPWGGSFGEAMGRWGESFGEIVGSWGEGVGQFFAEWGTTWGSRIGASMAIIVGLAIVYYALYERSGR